MFLWKRSLDGRCQWWEVLSRWIVNISSTISWWDTPTRWGSGGWHIVITWAVNVWIKKGRYICFCKFYFKIAKLSSSWQVQCQFNWELRLVLGTIHILRNRVMGVGWSRPAWWQALSECPGAIRLVLSFFSPRINLTTDLLTLSNAFSSARELYRTTQDC